MRRTKGRQANSRRDGTEALRLLRQLRSEAESRLEAADDGAYRLVPARPGSKSSVDAALVRSLLARGLLAETAPGRIRASREAEAWLIRAGQSDQAFRAQHHAFELAAVPGEPGATALRNLEESPVAALARRVGRGGTPWLSPHEIEAAERFRRDFEQAQLRPRVTANWSAAVRTGSRAGAGGEVAELTDMAIGARRRFEHAVEATGPEFSGLLVDICCFLKGLEAVERERQWPARSAKLVLRLALSSLARHYGLGPVASGPARARGVHHWGAKDYRPKIG